MNWRQLPGLCANFVEIEKHDATFSEQETIDGREMNDGREMSDGREMNDEAEMNGGNYDEKKLSE